MSSFIDVFLLFPEVYGTVISIVFLLWGAWLRNKSSIVFITTFGYLFTFCLLFLLILVIGSPSSNFCLLNFHYHCSELVLCVKVVFILFLMLSLFVSFEYFILEKIFFTEYYFFLGLLTISAFFLIASNDFILFYFALELQALILYTLAALKRYTAFSTESGLKYFVLGAFSSGLILFGISLLYGLTGITNFFDFKFIFLKWLDSNTYFGLYMAVGFLLAGILFKLSAAPFHI